MYTKGFSNWLVKSNNVILPFARNKVDVSKDKTNQPLYILKSEIILKKLLININ